MATTSSRPDPADGAGDAARELDRAARAHADVRHLAARLASTADDIAATLDRVAETRESRAKLGDAAEVDSWRRAARRARDIAEAERRESRTLREKWGLQQD